MKNIGVEAAHIRFGDVRYGKRPTGIGEKPSDQWTLPLHYSVHRTGKDAQHNTNERKWWEKQGIDPCAVALALWNCGQDIEAGEATIREAHQRALIGRQ